MEECMGRLDGRVAIITGGASGIGEGTVRLFVKEGARVVIADIQDDRGQALVGELGGGAIFQHADVSIEDDVRGVVDAATKAFGQLDVMFNNAGVLGTAGPIDEIPADEFDRAIAVLLRSVFLGMKHAAPVMKAQGSGSIISTASIAGVHAGYGPHVYATAKAGVIHLTKSVALELAVHHVRVNAICPGAILTPLTSGAPPRPEQRQAIENVFLKFQPLPHVGVPLDIARAALWLASAESSFVTGQAIVVDGAATAGIPWERQPSMFKERRGGG
jgi:NAD(P)-dependent dehydrogenase (short-subunit alcohol dehydrogenase family)